MLEKLFNKRKPVRFPVPKIKMRRGEYDWRASIYSKTLSSEQPLCAFLFRIEADAKAFKKAVERSTSRPHVKIEKRALADEDGWIKS